jgi:predicted nucleic acid-binding protein
MAQATVVADASPLIALGWIDRLDLLPGLFVRVVVPPAVAAEVTRRGAVLPGWVAVRPPVRAADARVFAARLGAGESEVLGLGLEIEDALLILDDREARALARELGLKMIGTAALLVEAKRAGLLPEVRPLLDALLDKGFWLAPRVYDVILKAVGERKTER